MIVTYYILIFYSFFFFFFFFFFKFFLSIKFESNLENIKKQKIIKVLLVEKLLHFYKNIGNFKITININYFRRY